MEYDDLPSQIPTETWRRVLRSVCRYDAICVRDSAEYLYCIPLVFSMGLEYTIFTFRLRDNHHAHHADSQRFPLYQ